VSVIDCETLHASLSLAVSPTKISISTDCGVFLDERWIATLIYSWIVPSTKSDVGFSSLEGIDQIENGHDGDEGVVSATLICSSILIDPSYICHFFSHEKACMSPPHENGTAMASASVEILTDEAIPGRVLDVGLCRELGRLAPSVEWHLIPVLGSVLRLVAYEPPWRLSQPRSEKSVRS
jgi:hypothetical protein